MHFCCVFLFFSVSWFQGLWHSSSFLLLLSNRRKP
jgi:hypothetical protein